LLARDIKYRLKKYKKDIFLAKSAPGLKQASKNAASVANSVRREKRCDI
jgi:hypothetical protein